MKRVNRENYSKVDELMRRWIVQTPKMGLNTLYWVLTRWLCQHLLRQVLGCLYRLTPPCVNTVLT